MLECHFLPAEHGAILHISSGIWGLVTYLELASDTACSVFPVSSLMINGTVVSYGFEVGRQQLAGNRSELKC